MALQKEIQTHGLTLDTAYVKVSEINWSDQKYWGAAKQGMTLEDGTASDEYLKTLDEFQGTEDA
jgi:hypothetical protein|tara:strand:- start:370 stop:561 length:192 start_codon:yes stop_codon:yes gene_type:complete